MKDEKELGLTGKNWKTIMSFQFTIQWWHAPLLMAMIGSLMMGLIFGYWRGQ